MYIEPIDQGNAWQIKDVDITNLTTEDYAQIREWLMTKLILVFKNQPKDTYAYGKLIHNIGYGKTGVASEGSISNQESCFWNGDAERLVEFYKPDPNGGQGSLGKMSEWFKRKYQYPEDYVDDPIGFPIQRVTGQKDKDEVPGGIFGKGKLLWHSNLNGIRMADGVSLQGWEGCVNTSTEFLNTARCRADMDPELVKALHTAYGEYRISPDQWSPEIDIVQKAGMNWGAGRFRAWVLQTNRAGTQGIFFNPLNSAKLFGDVDDIWNTVYDHYFNNEYLYVHWWEPGDIVLMDQLLTLHQRGQHDPEILAHRVLHRYEFRLSNYENWMQKNNVVIPGRVSRDSE
jgi:hypothetical protein